MWQPGEVIAWRGIDRGRIWHLQPTILVKDSPGEIVLALLPGAECMAEESYPQGKKNGRRRWEFINGDWHLTKYTWKTNRLLLLFEPEKYYSTVLFGNDWSDDLLCYYINFQLPLKRHDCALDTLDLDLDIVIHPDFTYEWKDVDDYQKAISHGIILPEWVQEIDLATSEIMDRLEKRRHPFDGCWLNWRPADSWLPPKLPANWDKI